MAKRRCFSVDVMESDSYYQLSDKAKILYVVFMLHSDDDGVVINPNAVMRMYEANRQMLTELVDSGFLLVVDDIYVITHWCIHNKIPPSKKTDSLYRDQLKKLTLSQTGEYMLTDYVL